MKHQSSEHSGFLKEPGYSISLKNGKFNPFSDNMDVYDLMYLWTGCYSNFHDHLCFYIKKTNTTNLEEFDLDFI